MPVLEALNLKFAYRIGERSFPVLKGIDFRVEHGEFLAIQGSSGSGKSTLLYLLGCLLKQDSGMIRLDGHEITADHRPSDESPARLRNQTIGFVFQQFHLLARASVLDNILLPAGYPCETASITEADRAKARLLAERLGLSEHLNNLPNQLSGGQQQRVAIARALMRDPKLILADEPTGNLDSRNSAEILKLFGELNREGRTILIITHDPEVARQCRRVVHMKDGLFLEAEATSPSPSTAREPDRERTPEIRLWGTARAYLHSVRRLLPLAWENLMRNKSRSALTMIGITIGIAAVLSMLTLGSFAQRKILESYEAMGVNKLRITGQYNWRLKASDRVAVNFQSFDMDKDLLPLKVIFSQLKLLSPVFSKWGVTANYGGRNLSDGVTVSGINEQALAIMNRKVIYGQPINAFHVELRSNVCLIGMDIVQNLFANVDPLGQILNIGTSQNPLALGCRVIGVLAPQTSNNEWIKPNLQIAIPYTVYPVLTDNWWERRLDSFIVQLEPGSDIELTGKAIKAYFEQKYPKTAIFNVASDDIMVAQLKRFLGIFSVLLGSIAFISLLVGSIGITNMMLVSVSERFKEIGLRKALGATDFSIRLQFLLEAILLCTIAGVVGMAAGFATYEALIFGASKLVSKVRFEWILEPAPLIISVASILAVGVASGLIPAFRAERLQVIEALRSE